MSRWRMCPIEEGHPERVCEMCGGPNVVWSVDSELWNEIMWLDREAILCPTCFALRCEDYGEGGLWRLERAS